jgi:hypothetical protein
VTVAEVKTILRITDEYFQEIGILPHKVANRNAVIIQIASDTLGTCVYSSADYKTSQSWDKFLVVDRTSSTTISMGDSIAINYKLAELDSWIAEMIPIVESDIIDYCNNSFPDVRTRMETSNLILTSKTSSVPAKINNPDALFSSRGFAPGAIFIEGNGRNNGLVYIDSVSDSVMSLSTNYDLYADSQYSGMYRLTRVNWPQDMKRVIAYIIQYNLIRLKDPGVGNKSIGGISLGYESVAGGGYSPSIYQAIARHRLAYIS